MNNLDFIPRKDADFLQWINSFVSNLENLIEKSGFPQYRYDQIVIMKNNFTEKFKTAENIATRTVISVQAKKESRKELEKEIRLSVKEFLTYNRILTDTDRISLGLPVHKTSRTPSPVADTYPFFDIDSSIIRRLSVHYYDFDKKSKAKPAGQHGAEIRWEILDTPPQTINDMKHSAFETRSPFTVEFDENQRGKTVYLCICWENTRGQKGPWSEIVSAIIP